MQKKVIKIRTSEELKDKVRQEAENCNMSMNQFVELVLAARYDEQQKNILDTYKEISSTFI